MLLKWVEKNPDIYQSYRKLEKETGIPKSTIWELVNWDPASLPGCTSPLDCWAIKLNMRVIYVHEPGRIIAVYKFNP